MPRKTKTTEEQNLVKVERFERQLPCKLTDQELLDRGARNAILLRERYQKEADMKSAQKHAKAQIAEIETEMARIGAEINDKAALRLTGCERRFDYKAETVSEFRSDTGEQLDVRRMSEYERQTELPLDGEAADGDDE